MEHGERHISGITRYCAVHGFQHGRFYLCEYYSEELRRQIKQEERQYLAHSAALWMAFFMLLAGLFMAL